MKKYFGAGHIGEKKSELYIISSIFVNSQNSEKTRPFGSPPTLPEIGSKSVL